MVWWVSLVHCSRLLCALVAMVCLLATTVVYAEQEPILLEYSADVGCPSGAEFERMVFERAHSARPAVNREPARLFTVAIRTTSQGVQGSLTVREGGVSLVRQVRGKNCRQLANVLALAAALAIDPAADLAPAREADEEPDDTAGVSEAEREPSAGVTVPREQQTRPVQMGGASRQSDAAAVPAVAAEEERTHDFSPRTRTVLFGELGLGPRLELGATPYPAVGPHVSVGLLSANGRWRAQLGGSWLLTPDKQVGTAGAEFRVLTANLSLCALALQWREHVSGGPCLHAEVGDVYGRGTDIDYETTVHRLWSTAGAHIHVRIPHDDTWFFAANIGANVLLQRYSFEFNEPDTEVFSQSAVTGTINAILGMLF